MKEYTEKISYNYEEGMEDIVIDEERNSHWNRVVNKANDVGGRGGV